MTSNIFQFLLDFATTLGNMATNLWNLLQQEIGGIKVWALLGSGVLIATILYDIIKAIVS